MEYEIRPPVDEAQPIPRSLRNWTESPLPTSDPRTKPGELMWPERFPRDIVDQHKVDLGSYGFAAQDQQRPAPAGGGIFKDTWWKFWIPANSELGPVTVIRKDTGKTHTYPVKVLPRAFWLQLQSWDLNFDSSESMVSGHVYKVAGIEVFVGTDERRGAWDFGQTLREFRGMTLSNPGVLLKIVEDAANARALLSTLKTEIAGIVLQPPQGDKIMRARAQAPKVEAGNVYLPHPAIAPWVWDWILEFGVFSDNSPFKDRVDDWSQAMKRIEIETKRRKNAGSNMSVSSMGS
jgi:predicted phage terminase large subunit-like protein